jgi:deoxyribodipyrimidine photo-lyase
MLKKASPVSIFWFRRDLRLHDNAGLYHALKGGDPVLPIFIFDRSILDQLEDKTDQRVAFIHQALQEIQLSLTAMGSSLEVYYGFPREIFGRLLKEQNIRAVYTNHDYEPYARERDGAVGEMLTSAGIPFHTYKDQVIFEKTEVVKDDGKPYTVFTPYSKKWKSLNPSRHFPSYETDVLLGNFFRQSPSPIPTFHEMGFREVNRYFPPREVRDELIRNYASNRDYPGIPGTSRLGLHLRFGTISIRELATRAASLNETFLNELIWREFYQMILWHFPQVGKGKAFRPEYEGIRWRNDEVEFGRWCRGETGYPIVDAGMRELNETGYMHNRVRMIVASFLSKHLLIDWRWGEAYFAQKLLDFDLASNNGGWQWASGSGCDAAPYFRIFNPYLQTLRFDPELKYIRRWVPEYESLQYPSPMVVHELARKRCLDAYKKVLGSNQ